MNSQVVPVELPVPDFLSECGNDSFWGNSSSIPYDTYNFQSTERTFIFGTDSYPDYDSVVCDPNWLKYNESDITNKN